jgi:hypothetical protein
VIGAGAARLVVVVVAARALASCGSPYCGDGNEDEGEECDDGNDNDMDFCRACTIYSPPRTVVKWDLNRDVTRGFNGDSCTDMSVANVRVDVAGPTTASLEDACSTFQVTFSELPVGDYTVGVTPLDQFGTPLVTAPVPGMVTATDGNVETEIIVPYSAWSGSYTGSFIFNLTWGGLMCPAPIVNQVLTMEVLGQPVTQVTDTGQQLDGSDPQPCRVDEHLVSGVPFGPATFTVEGRDSGGVTRMEHTFQTFVGVGISNPTFAFDLPPVDAAVDATVDAAVDGMPDA